jgi:hypothetical protein
MTLYHDELTAEEDCRRHAVEKNRPMCVMHQTEVFQYIIQPFKEEETHDLIKRAEGRLVLMGVSYPFGDGQATYEVQR